MSAESKPQLPDAHEHVLNDPNAPEGSTPEAAVTTAVTHFRKEFITLLKSLNQSMEKKERRAARSDVARTCLVGPRVFRPEHGKAADLQDRSALPRLRDSRHAVCSPVRRNSIGGESGRVDGSGGSEVHVSTEVGGFQPAPAVAPDRRSWEGPAGGTREKRC